MTTLEKVVGELGAVGAIVEAAATDRLRIDGPQGAVTPKLQAAVREYKYEILNLLEDGWIRVEWCLGDDCDDRVLFVKKGEGENEWQGYCHSHGMSLRLIENAVH